MTTIFVLPDFGAVGPAAVTVAAVVILLAIALTWLGWGMSHRR